MFQTKDVKEIKTHFMFSYLFFENRTVYDIMWKNKVERGGPQMAIWRMRIACWIPKATNTILEYVILISFPLQQWLRERASMLRHSSIAQFGCTAKSRPNNQRRLQKLPSTNPFKFLIN
jgi:hypothetical protein